MQNKYLLVLAGATAVGKTALAIRLAQHFQTDIISADSRQFYREMSIATAVPSENELSLVTHHFIHHLSIFDEKYDVGKFENECITLLDNLYIKNNICILTGGTGLYIKAICEGLDEFPDVPKHITDEINMQYEKQGLAFLQNTLKEVDAEYFETVDKQNPHRLMRAIAVCKASGQPFSHFRKGASKNRGFTPIYICIDRPREELYERINHRVDEMLQSGLEAEASALFPHRHLQALQTVGCQEFFDYFEGKTDYNTTVSFIKQHTRNYAKRQLTWFRKQMHFKHFQADNFSEILTYLHEKMNM